MSTVLACDPDELDATAHALSGAAAELGALAGEVLGAGDAAWSGLAALEQAARRREAADLLERLGTPLEEVAGALTQVAAAAREQGEVVRRHSLLRDERALERSRLLALGPPPEPVAGARWAETVALLQEEVERLQRLVDAAEREFDRAQRLAAEILGQVRAAVPRIVWDLGLTFMTAQKAAEGWRQVTAAGAMADSLRRLRRMTVPGGERTLHRVRERVEKHVTRLRHQPPRWISKVPGGAVVAGRAVPVVVVADAGHKVVTGGGYEGWRSGVTRGLAGAAIVGIGVAVLVPAAATAGVVGLGAAVVYQGWMTGNWIYDNRDRIRSTASRAWSGTTRFGGRVLSQGRSLLGRARARASSGLDRLRASRDRTSGHTGRRDGTDPVAPGVAPFGATT